MKGSGVGLLLAGFTAVLVLAGGWLGGGTGMALGLLLAIALDAVAYLAAPGLVLRGYGARIVRESEAPGLHHEVALLCAQAGLPMPALAIASYPQPNAFVVGRDAQHAVLCVTDALLSAFDGDELEAVLAHELAHVQNQDVPVRTFAAAVAGTIGDSKSLGVLLGGPPRERRHPVARVVSRLLAPVSGMVARVAIRPDREFEADAAAVRITGQPRALASALSKLDALARVPVDVPLAVELLAEVEPMEGHESEIVRRWATHPSVEERVARLTAMAERSGLVHQS